MKRRGLLLGIGTTFATAVAGCTSSNGGDGETTTATAAVEGYFQALADGDREGANQFAHPDGDYYVEDDEHPFLNARNLTISETEIVDVEVAVRHMYEEPEDVQIDEAVEDEKAALERVQDEYGFDDYAYVRHDADADGLTFNSIYLLFEGDEGWVIWSVPTFHLTG